MIQIDLEIPKCCDECKFVYDSCCCIITGSRIDWDKSDSERLLDCPLNKIAEPKTGHWEWVSYDYNSKLGDWHCSECRCVVVECVDKNEKGGIPLYKYCPQCGTKMVEPQEREEV